MIDIDTTGDQVEKVTVFKLKDSAEQENQRSVISWWEVENHNRCLKIIMADTLMSKEEVQN